MDGGRTVLFYFCQVQDGLEEDAGTPDPLPANPLLAMISGQVSAVRL